LDNKVFEFEFEFEFELCLQTMTAVASTMKRLQRLDFPECTREALQYIVSTYESQDGSPIPGLAGGPEAAVGEMCQSFVLFRTKRGVKVSLFWMSAKISTVYKTIFLSPWFEDENANA
jgi:hypothetical protein